MDLLDRIFGPDNIASGASVVFTGTTGHVYTIKNITLVNNTGTPITIKMGIGGLTDAELILPESSIDAGGMAVFDGLQVLTATETIEVNASASGLTIHAAGLDQS